MAPLNVPELLVTDSTAFADWLAVNHGQSEGVWLILAKKNVTEPTSLTYDQALEAALCHGWIDGQRRSRDAATFTNRFTPRRRASPWSKRNVGIVERLTVEGRMLPAGIAEVERAKADGRWDAAYAGPATAEVPDDLAAALSASPAASAMFATLNSVNRFAVIYRVGAAKKPETRARRIVQFIEMLERGETIHP